MADDHIDADAERMARARLREAIRPRRDETERDETGRAASHVALGREHLRRMALWATALACEERWPFFDVALCAIPALAEPASIPDFLPAHAHSHRVRESFAAWLRYVALSRARALACHGLDDPYLPLVRIVERGGTFHTHKQIFYCGVRGIPYNRRLPLPAAWLAGALALNDTALDALDAAERAKGGS